MGELAEIKSARQARERLVRRRRDDRPGRRAHRGKSSTSACFTGFMLTKLDGDARGGAALSIKAVTGKPIKFLGMGEGSTRSRSSAPRASRSRILGFGDVVGLMQDFEKHVDEETAEKDAKKMLSRQVRHVGLPRADPHHQEDGLASDLFEKLPFFGDGMPEGVKIDDKAARAHRVDHPVDDQVGAQQARAHREAAQRACAASAGLGHPRAGGHRAVQRFKGCAPSWAPSARPVATTCCGSCPASSSSPRCSSSRAWPTPEMLQQMLPGLPKGYLPPGMPSAYKAPAAGSAADKKKDAARKKAKAARTARKKQKK
jgi:signal recognition particle subunit SRP54